MSDAERVRAFALGLPGAREEFPWGDRVVKVNGKIFAFLGDEEKTDDDHLHVGVKLPESREPALTLPHTEPMRYGLGRHGWVVGRFPAGSEPPLDLLLEWIEESYRAIAPKRLVAELDQRNASTT